MTATRVPFREVWAVDFEFTAPPGHRPTPICVVARELHFGRVVRQWLEGEPCPSCQYPTGVGALFLSFVASAELSCHLALGWPMPERVIDLNAEFRNLTNGLSVPCGRGLLGAMAYFGLPALNAVEKKELQALAMRGGPYTATEQAQLLDYCETDVDALAKLWPAMLPRIDVPRALFRGRYMVANARMESVGTPIDVEALGLLRQHWNSLKAELVRELDKDYGVYVPTGFDPRSQFGSAVLQSAESWGLDPYALAEAAEYVHKQDHEAHNERLSAIRSARRDSGMTIQKVNRLRNAGKDYVDVPGFDALAREIAGAYPALGIGPGYEADVPDLDYSPLLWEMLSEPDPKPKPKSDPDVLRRAADLVGPGGCVPTVGPRSFSAVLWERYLVRAGIPWPRLPSGALALDDDTFRDMAKVYPAQIGPMRELRHSLGQLRLNDLSVGPDGRNRCVLWAFHSKTGRNQPSNSAFIFGPSVWLRSFINPAKGRAIAYVDWSQQELGIAAALSGDARMQEAYTSGDFYLSFAKMAGAVPPDATKQTHGHEREQFKAVALGVLYGMSAEGMARKLGVPHHRGRDLLRLHQTTFRQFWQWSDAVEAVAMLTNELYTVFGWTVRVGRDANPRSLRNFPMQGNGAEMMRLAACYATEAGLNVCAPVHDAFLVEAPADAIHDATERMQAAMRRASADVLPGFPLKTDAKIVCYPDRYSDPRGGRMWETVTKVLARLGGTPVTDDG